MLSSRSLVVSRALVKGSRPTASRRFITSGSPKRVGVDSIVEADAGALSTKFYHLSNTALLIAAPVAFVLSPSMFNFPVDLALGVVFPLHAHIGLNYVISDYVPKASRPLARYALLGTTGITILGLLRLNITGPGITETFKALWREKHDH